MAEYSTLSKSESPMWCWLVSDPRRENSRNAINLLDHLASKERRRGQHGGAEQLRRLGIDGERRTASVEPDG